MDTLYYTVHNLESTKIPVVLLHGFLESSTMWKHVQFPKDYPRIQIDLPGHGKSTHPNLLCDTIGEMAKLVRTVLDELKVDQFHLIGHSMGGYIALELKKTNPRAEKVLQLNSNFWADSKQKVVERMRVAEIVQTSKSHFIYEVIPNLFLEPQQHDSEVKELIKEALKISPEAIAKFSMAMSKRENFTEFVRENATDFTSVQGVEDRIVLVSHMRKSTEEMAINYIELDRVGHMAHFEAPYELNRIVDRFLK